MGTTTTKTNSAVHPIRDGLSLLCAWSGIGWMLYTDRVIIPILGICGGVILGIGAANLYPYLPGFKAGTPEPSAPSPEEARG